IGPADPTGDLAQLVPLLDAQLASRWLDVAARRMRAANQGFYTIGSAGHEADAAVALATRPTDPALLHYRSGGFYLARSTQAGRTTPSWSRASVTRRRTPPPRRARSTPRAGARRAGSRSPCCSSARTTASGSPSPPLRGGSRRCSPTVPGWSTAATTASIHSP